MVLRFSNDTYSTLDMLVVLRDTYKNLLVTKKSRNRLSLSLGKEHDLWFFHYLGANHWKSGFSIAFVAHGRLV